ncbi:MAG: DUF721 domain-containing protein [Treponema sp.]|nr:DUF721 domain-containing protein [Treponema sp.]
MRRAGDILTEVLRDNFGPNFQKEAKAEMEMFSSWDSITMEVWSSREPPPVAEHSKIKELEHGTLLIEADHPGWVQILQSRKEELLPVIRKRYPEMNIKAISIKLGKH